MRDHIDKVCRCIYVDRWWAFFPGAFWEILVENIFASNLNLNCTFFCDELLRKDIKVDRKDI